MFEVLGFEFMQNALMAGLLSSLVCGIIGVYVVVNRIVFVSGGIAHAAYGGVGLAFFFGFAPLLGIFAFSLVLALVMAGVSMGQKHRADTVIGVLWAVGMALGVILVDLTPGYNVDLMSILFGSILAVTSSDLWAMLAMASVLVLLAGWFHQDFVALAHDEQFARTRGVSARFLYCLLMVMVALAVVVVVQVVGLILVVAFLTIAPYIAGKFSRSMLLMMVFSVVLNVIFTVAGLFFAYVLNLSSGPSIIMVGGFFFFLSWAHDRVKVYPGTD